MQSFQIAVELYFLYKFIIRIVWRKFNEKIEKNIERNKLDYLLTDIMPVEVSELFSFSKFYEYLLSKQSTLDDIVSKMRAMKAENSETPFAGGKWGNWATSPLKFNILKGTDSIRGLNLVQPLSAMNIYFFVECYQKELLDILSNNSCFSLRYHRKNSDLFYRRKSKKFKIMAAVQFQIS